MVNFSAHLTRREYRGIFALWTAAVLSAAPSVSVGVDHLHSLSPAYHASVLEAEESGTYTFHSPGISYGAVLGKRFGARVRLTAFFPAHLFQEGRYFYASDYYSSAVGGEALLGVTAALPLKGGQRLIFDVGPDITAIKLDSQIYSAFMNLTFGIGAGVEYTHSLCRLLTLGVFVTAALHFVDFIHETNARKTGVFITSGITLGLHFDGRAS